MSTYPINQLKNVNIYELDVVVGAMVFLTFLHAWNENKGGLKLVAGAFVTSLLIETASIRAGGTHCHHESGILNFSHCSSANSVLYYVPWAYSCLASARKLVGDSSKLLPMVCSVLFFGFCGAYELQGPSMGWWTWPDEKGVHKNCIPEKPQIWQPHSPADDGKLEAVPHVVQALQDRFAGVPLSAPLFHMAIGWGFAISTQYTQFQNGWLPALATPALGMLWDPAARLLALASGCTFGEGAAIVMAISPVIALCCFSSSHGALPKSKKVDWLLFSIPLINELYLASIGLRNPDVISGLLQAVVYAICGCSVLLHARACGISPKAVLKLISTEQKPAKPVAKKVTSPTHSYGTRSRTPKSSRKKRD